MSTNILTLLSSMTAITLITLVSQRHHILMCLLSLEATLLTLAFTSAIMSSMHLFYCILILSFGACEAALALSVLVMITRSFGSDMLQSMNTNKC